MSTKTFVRFASTVAAGAAIFAVAPQARAQSDIRTPLGAKRTLVLDDLSGFRASSVGGVGYAGPIGISFQSLSENTPAGAGQTSGSVTDHYTNVWFAPSADYFVIDHLSIGGLLEITSTSGSETTQTNVGNTNTTTKGSLPTTTNVTILPRVGWMFGITDRFGIWPRLGLGYGARTVDPNGANTTSDTFSAFIVDLDVGFLYRFNQTFFLSGRPELTLAPGSHSDTTGNTTVSTGASFFQFALVGGVGIMLDL
jgi:hypothetical protein